MQLSAPIYQLKRKAKGLAKAERIPLHQALDRVAAAEGYGRWSLLAAKHAAVSPAQKLLAQLAPGDLALIAGRPGQGKTLLSLELAAEAMKAGRVAAVFSFEFTEAELRESFREIGADVAAFGDLFVADCSDDICAELIAERLALAPSGAVAVIDYLQLLDQKRDAPDLMTQVRALHALARERGLVLIFISQIDRAFDPSARAVPELRDVRLPNALDLTLFSKACFLHGGEMRFGAVS